MKNRQLNVRKIIWYGGMLVFTFIALVMSLQTQGKVLENLFFRNFADFAMDFFNHLKYVAERNPYEFGLPASFPAFAYLIYFFLYCCVPYEAGGRALLLGEMKLSCIENKQAGIYFILMLYVMVITILLTLVVMRIKKGNGIEKVFFLFLLVFSGPYLYMWERENIVILANIFLIAFLWGRNSSRPWIREMSFLALAAAASLKLYPALAGILLIREKRWKEAFRTVLYGLIFFFLPFAFFGGMEGFLQWKDNILSVQAMGRIDSQAVSLGNGIRVLEGYIGQNVIIVEKLFPLIVLLLGCISIFYLEQKWKRAAVLCGLMIVFPDWSSQYTLVLMTAPLVLFLDEKIREKKVLEGGYALIYVGIFSCLLGSPRGYLNISCLVEMLSLYLLLLLLIIEGLAAGICKLRIRANC